MSPDQTSLLSTAFRIFVISMTNVTMHIYVTGKILKKRKSLCGIYSYMFVKVILHTVLIGVVLQHYYAGETWLAVLNTAVVCVTAVLSYVIFYLTFEGEFIRIAVVTGIVEMSVLFLGYFGLAMVNLLERRADIWDAAGNFRLPDLILPVVDYILLWGILHIAGSYLRKLGTCRLKYKKLLWAVFLVYIAFGSMTIIQSLSELTRPNQAIIVFVIFSLVILVIAVRRYSSGILREKEFLSVRQRLGQTHYETIQRQIRQMEHSQQVIDGQMEKIRQMEETENFDSEVVASYLEQIRDAHEEIRAGIYCDNWMIDALLYSQTSLFEKGGKELICSMQGYTEGRVPEEDMVQILTLLLEYAKRADAGKEIVLNVTTVGSQTVAELVTAGEGKVRLLKRKLKPYLKKYDGTLLCRQECGQAKFHLTISLRES